MGIVDPTIVHRLKELQKDQERQHQELMTAIDTNNKWLAHIAAVLERQAPMQGGVYQQAGGTR